MSEICSNPERYKNNENENITKDGKTVWISWTNKAIDDDHGDLIGILSVGNDITDRKIAEQLIKESEEKFRTITEQSFIGICIIKDYRFIYVNKQLSDSLGYSSEELLELEPRALFNIIHPEDRVRILNAVERRNIENEGVIANIQFRITKKTGEVIWLEVTSKPFTYQGKSASLIATLDITEKNKAEKIVLEENKKLVELNQMRKDIITRVSHELKTPLTSMFGASQILLKHLDEELSDNVLKFVEIFHRGALRLKKLVENLIDASRIETGKLHLNLTDHDLVKIIRECVDEMSYLLDNRRLSIRVEYPEKIILKLDKIRLQQVITNIMSNAIKNTPLQGIIFININENSDHVDIKIRDTGIGITEKEKGLLFEKFGKIERYGKDLGVDIEGSGLGLYISKEIIELHGGQILVESEGRNNGALFTVRLYKN
jgi:PAS domain S-box-containing protein